MVCVTNKCMVSYDVTCLLTNIPLEEIIHTTLIIIIIIIIIIHINNIN